MVLRDMGVDYARQQYLVNLVYLLQKMAEFYRQLH
jgi:hypothetical protein